MKDIWPESAKRLAEHLSNRMKIGLAVKFYAEQPDGFVQDYRPRAGEMHSFEFTIHNMAIENIGAQAIADRARDYILEELRVVEQQLKGEVGK